MKAKDLIGKTVKSVVQQQIDTNAGKTWVLDEIVFTDGTVFVPQVHETETGYVVSGVVYKAKTGS